MDIQRAGSTAPVTAGIVDKPITPQPVQVAKPAAAQVPADTPDAVTQAGAVPQAEELAQATKEINDALRQYGAGLEFSVDEDSQRTIVKVIDQDTKEVIRQIPSEDVLQIARALDQALGLLIRDKA